MARQPSGKKDASPDDALDDVQVTDEVDAVENSSPSTTDAVDSSDADVDEDVSDEEDDAEDSEEDDSTEDDEVAASADDEASGERSAEAAALWSDVRIEPVEIALPKGVGFTLRAYRMSNELAPVEVVEEEDDAFAVLNRTPVVEEDEELDVDDEFVDERPGVVQEDAPAARRRRGKDADEDEVEDDEDETAALDKDEDSGENDSGDDETDEELADEEELSEAEIAEALAEDDEDEDEKEPEPEEVPVFLGSGGKLLLFRSADGLVEFVKSADEHDLAQLDTWADLRERITAEAIVPNDEDSYELDLVVENLRGGHDAWDTDLLIGAGEAARDLAYALRLEAVRTALSPGSPLDDLDEGLRSSANGGMGGFFARRRLKKIGAQQAALGWRTIIGKISAVVDWRD